MKKEYEINYTTLILLPEIHNCSKIYEESNTYYIKKSPTKILKDSCIYFGCSYDGRHTGTKELINVAIKSPIVVEESKKIIFFPTSSPREEKCIWISYNNLIKYYKKKQNTVLCFKNNKEIEISVSYNIIDNQIVRCIKLEKEMIRRKKHI